MTMSLFGCYFVMMLCTIWLINASPEVLIPEALVGTELNVTEEEKEEGSVCEFSSSFVKGVTIRKVRAGCHKWVAGRFWTCVTGGARTKTFTSITVKSSLGKSYSCYDKLVATRLCVFMDTKQTYICDGHTWRSGQCGWQTTYQCLSVDQPLMKCGKGASVRPCVSVRVKNKTRSIPDWGGIGQNCNAPSQVLSVLCGGINIPPKKASKKYNGCRFVGHTTAGTYSIWKSQVVGLNNYAACDDYRLMQKCTIGKKFSTVSISSASGTTYTCSDPKIATSVCTESWLVKKMGIKYRNKNHGFCNGHQWVSGWYGKGVGIAVDSRTGQCDSGGAINVCSGIDNRQGGVGEMICNFDGRTISMSCGIGPAPTKKPTARPTKKQTPTASTYYYNGYYYFNNGSWVGYYE